VPLKRFPFVYAHVFLLVVFTRCIYIYIYIYLFAHTLDRLMEELKDKSLHLTAEKLTEELQKMDNYNGFYEKLQVLTFKRTDEFVYCFSLAFEYVKSSNRITIRRNSPIVLAVSTRLVSFRSIPYPIYLSNFESRSRLIGKKDLFGLLIREPFGYVFMFTDVLRYIVRLPALLLITARHRNNSDLRDRQIARF